MTNKNPTKYSPKAAPAPVYFVDPTTGEPLTIDLNAVTFSKKGAS